MGDEQQVVVLSLKLEDDGLQANSKVVVRLSPVNRALSKYPKRLTSARGYL